MPEFLASDRPGGLHLTLDLDQLPRLGRGRTADVLAYGEHALKLYAPGTGKTAVFREAATLALLEGTGLPVPKAVSAGCFDGRWGLVMSRGPGGGGFATDAPALAALIDLQLRLHAQPGAGLPSLKAKLAHNIRRAPALEARLRATVLARLAALPDGQMLCHGDFHPDNVLGTPDAPLIVDWLDATEGPPEADACRTYLLALVNLPPLAAPYLALYAERSGRPAASIQAWLPVVAAARLAEGVLHETPQLLALATGAASV